MSDKDPGTLPASVVFHSYPKLLFCWPLIVAGPIFWLLTKTPVPPEVLGWGYLTIATLVFLAMGIDIERNFAFVIGVIVLLIFFLGLWLQSSQHFEFFGNIFGWLLGMGVKYDDNVRGLGLGLSIALGIPFAFMLVWSRLQDKWRITHNDFEHLVWGRSDDSLARGAKRVRTTYPDLLELLLAGAGTLIIYSASGQTELLRIQHVPMLPRLRRRIEHLVEATAVVVQPEIESASSDESHGEDAAHGESGVGGEKL